MVIRNLDAMGAVGPPFEANPPLIIDADRMSAAAIAFQGLEPVARWRAQVA
jgi:hypothetical protein